MDPGVGRIWKMNFGRRKWEAIAIVMEGWSNPRNDLLHL